MGARTQLTDDTPEPLTPGTADAARVRLLPENPKAPVPNHRFHERPIPGPGGSPDDGGACRPFSSVKCETRRWLGGEWVARQPTRRAGQRR